MKAIKQTLNTFVQALRQKEQLIFNKKGEWNYTPYFFRIWKKFLHNVSVVDAFVQELTRVELSNEEKVDYSNYQEAGQLILESNASIALQQRLIAMSYRLEEVELADYNLEQAARLYSIVYEWKKQQDLIPQKELTVEEKAKIKETTSYSLFASLLLEDSELQERFFQWVIRDRNDAAIFIQYPALQEKLVDCMLNGRIGRIGNGLLQIQKTDKKIVTLAFEGNPINILDETQRYTFKGGYTLTVAEVFEIFRNKFAEAGNLEFMAEGVINWHYLNLGHWDAQNEQYQVIDMEQAAWWEQLPAFETLTLQEARRRYGQHMDGYTWNVAATASRGSATLDYEQTHAYLDLAIPLGRGRYAIYDFGKFANWFPTNFMEVMSIFAFNVHASVGYPDENVFYTHRETAQHSFAITPEEGMRCLSSIRDDILVAREANFVYQIESDNCALWAHHKICDSIGEERVPDIFTMKLIDTEPVGPVAGLFALIRKFPATMHDTILVKLHLCLGAFKGTWIEENGQKVYKSLVNHDFWNEGGIYLPALLHRKIESGLLARVTNYLKRVIAAAIRPVRRFVKEVVIPFIIHTFERPEINLLILTRRKE